MNELQTAALRALHLMDLTTLNEDDTDETVLRLCRNANTVYGHVAAICIYPQFIPLAKKQLTEQGTPFIKIATVVNFPHGSTNIDQVVRETKAAVADGADEIDLVFPYRAFLSGDEQIGYELVAACKNACGSALLKVILETGELNSAANIQRASEIAIEAGADFIKTSTGKVAVNATPESAEIMLNVIKEMKVEDSVGFKAAGGVRTGEDALQFLALADRILGHDWVDSRHYRFGASSLLGSLLAILGTENDLVNGDY